MNHLHTRNPKQRSKALVYGFGPRNEIYFFDLTWCRFIPKRSIIDASRTIEYKKSTMFMRDQNVKLTCLIGKFVLHLWKKYSYDFKSFISKTVSNDWLDAFRSWDNIGHLVIILWLASLFWPSSICCYRREKFKFLRIFFVERKQYSWRNSCCTDNYWRYAGSIFQIAQRRRVHLTTSSWLIIMGHLSQLLYPTFVGNVCIRICFFSHHRIQHVYNTYIFPASFSLGIV